jgi:hypothetical protein
MTDMVAVASLQFTDQSPNRGMQPADSSIQLSKIANGGVSAKRILRKSRET